MAVAIGLVNAAYSLWLVASGQTRPHAFSLLVWLIIAAITCFNLMEQGAGAAAWRTVLTALACGINFLICLRHGFGYINRFDITVFVGALLGIPVWLVSSPEVSLYWLLLVQLFGGMPTMRKAYGRPYDLSVVVYTMAGAGFVLQLLALETYAFGMMLYFAMMGLQFFVIAATLHVRRRSIPVENLS